MSVKSLAYAVISSTDLEKWRDYGVNVCGLAESTTMPDNGALYLKMDQRPFRYMIQQGEYDGLFSAGWKVEDEAAFEALLSKLESAGHSFERVTDGAKLASRSASGMAKMQDPSGNIAEIIWESDSNSDDGVAFKSSLDVQSFITTARSGEDMGLGHVVLHAPIDYEKTHDFYSLLGLMDADITELGPMGKIYFMHCNPRHHSLALWDWGAPTPETDFKPSPESKATGCVHMMMEVGSLAEVGNCLDRVNERGIMVTSTLGEHINDEMVSFYMLTPGNFAMEFGYDGMQLDSSHKTTHNTEASKWGHKWTG